MFNFLFGSKKHSEKAIIGISPSSVLFISSREQDQFIKKDAADNAEKAAAIRECLESSGLGGKASVSVVFMNGLYREIQIDKPNVPEQELQGAVPWAIKDFVQESVNNLVVDYIDMPKAPTYPNEKIMAVAVSRDLIKTVAETVQSFGCVEIFTSENLALADLFIPETEDDDKPHLVLYQPDGYELTFLIIWHSRLYMVRNIRGFSDLPKYLSGALSLDVLENLSLEMQRSIDYVVSQLKIPQPHYITLAVDTQEREKITEYLTQTFLLSPYAGLERHYDKPAIYLPLLALLNNKDKSSQ